MAIEIEHKFAVDTSKWKCSGKGCKMTQAYLSNENCTVRIRITDEKAFLTIKSHSIGISREEYEYEIPLDDARNMLKLCLWTPIEKTRYIEVFHGKKWEIDVFEGANAGLVIAEIELSDEHEAFDIPAWAAEKLSGDKRYSNSYLSQHPYRTWEKSKPSSNLQ